MSHEQRLLCNDILERIQRIEGCVSHGRETCEQSELIQDSIILSFIVIGEAAKSLDATLTQQQPQVAWKSVAGFRDILVHQYRRTRLELVWKTAREDVPALKAAIEAILAAMDASD